MNLSYCVLFFTNSDIAVESSTENGTYMDTPLGTVTCIHMRSCVSININALSHCDNLHRTHPFS